MKCIKFHFYHQNKSAYSFENILIKGATFCKEYKYNKTKSRKQLLLISLESNIRLQKEKSLQLLLLILNVG